MLVTTLSLPIEATVADAYQRSSDDERERATAMVNTLLKAMLLPAGSQREKLAAFDRAAERAAEEAQASGWNDDLDAALLRGDFDD
jgi:hypothetical protein